MMAFERVTDNDGKYAVKVTDVDVFQVANQVKSVPDEYITEDGKSVTKKCIDYLLPLIQGEQQLKFYNGIPLHFVL